MPDTIVGLSGGTRSRPRIVSKKAYSINKLRPQALLVEGRRFVVFRQLDRLFLVIDCLDQGVSEFPVAFFLGFVLLDRNEGVDLVEVVVVGDELLVQLFKRHFFLALGARRFLLLFLHSADYLAKKSLLKFLYGSKR